MDLSNRSARELELVVQRLTSQLESKNEQIAELNEFIKNASASTQTLIKNFRAFCVKVLESELAYGDISSRDLESMTLDELLDRARNMLKQNQEKARGIYDTFKVRLTQKNEMIAGLTDQISQLKTQLDKAEELFAKKYVPPEDQERAAAYMLDTNTPLDAIKPSMATTTVADKNEHVVEFEGSADKAAVNLVSEANTYIEDLSLITSKMKQVHWDILQLIVENGISEISKARTLVNQKIKDDDEIVSPDKATRLITQLADWNLFSKLKVNTGMRWFTIVRLTEIGLKLYTQRFHKAPAETEYEMVIREHSNAEHGYTILDVAQILKDTGKYRSVSTSRKTNTIRLSENKTCIPDVVCCLAGGMEYYEVECGNHHQSDFNDKCDKLKSITQSIFFVAPNKETLEKKLKPQIEAWIKARGRSQLQLSGVVVYLTSISELAAQRWTYVFNMQSDKPIYTASTAPKQINK